MITAIILAAGESKRMGRPKMLLPWGDTTVLGQVVVTYQSAGVKDVVVITGGSHEHMERLVHRYGAHSVFNQGYASGEMLSSLQQGLRFLLVERPGVEAALVGLGDQPQVQAEIVQMICGRFWQGKPGLVVPSYRMKRGHPWIVARPLWEELLQLESPQSPREFLNEHAGEIAYVEVDTPSILSDLDTPQDYENFRP